MLLISKQAPSKHGLPLEERTIVGRVRVAGRRMLRGENKDVTTSLSGGCKITVEREQNSKEGWEGNK